MAAGHLRDRVTFQRATRTSDGRGGASILWQNLVTVWGGFRPERGREQLAAGRLESSVAGILTVRSSVETRAVAAADRVLIDDVAYQVRTIINPDRRDKYLELTIERGVATNG